MTRSCSGVHLALFAALVLSGCSGKSSTSQSVGAAGKDAGVVSSGGGGSGAVGAAGGQGAIGGSGGQGGQGFVTTCDDIGTEPTIPPACATVLATKTVTIRPNGSAGSGNSGGGGGAGGASAGGSNAGGAHAGGAGVGGANNATGGTGGASGVISDEATLDTDRIQAAIDACPSGQAVRLVTDGNKTAFVSAALFLRAGVTLWVDTGVTLYASRNPRDFDASPGLCGMSNAPAAVCDGLVNADGVNGAGLMGQGTLDGRGGELVEGQTGTWWDLEDLANGQLAAPRLVQVDNARGFNLQGVTLKNSAKFHVVLDTVDGFVIWGITINTPANAPNTDGIDPYACKNGVFAYNKISTGDDNIAIKGSGGPTSNLVIAHNHFGRGHGMSIGSETFSGVQDVRVCDLSLDGTGNGLRIKSDSSRGGVVQRISYTDVCMRGVRHPIVFDPFYSSATGTRIPDFRNILIRNAHVLDKGSSSLKGYDAAHPLSVTLDNVIFDDAVNSPISSLNAEVTLGPNPVNVVPTGTNVNVTKSITGSDPPRDCSNAWVSF